MAARVRFPDGTSLTAGRIMDARRDAATVVPDLGLYAHGSGRPTGTWWGRATNRVAGRPIHAGSWTPGWEVTWVRWPDMGVPADQAAAASAIEVAFRRARAGQRIDVRCLGGRGRTGTMLACMAVLAGVPVDEAVAWVRATYRPDAVERPAQRAWVAWFATTRAGGA